MATLDIRLPFSGPLRKFGLILLLNLIPVAGVLWLGWDAGQILVLYWIENVIIGATTLVRILTARERPPIGPGRKADGALRTGCFFVVHYGVFTLVHGVFTLVLAARLMGDADRMWRGTFGGETFHWAMLIAAALQVAMLVRDWWLSGLWRRSSPLVEMFRPYGRVVVLHVVVLATAWGFSAFSAPVWAVLILCLMKAAVELALTALTAPADT